MKITHTKAAPVTKTAKQSITKADVAKIVKVAVAKAIAEATARSKPVAGYKRAAVSNLVPVPTLNPLDVAAVLSISEPVDAAVRALTPIARPNPTDEQIKAAGGGLLGALRARRELERQATQR
jgi:hypothetical protein